jgi:cobyrinic acid a,c-diamide synthase
MGLFDGRSGVGGSGSSAELAKELQAPVFLVVDAKGMSGSIVPLVSGFTSYAQDMGVTIAYQDYKNPCR